MSERMRYFLKKRKNRKNRKIAFFRVRAILHSIPARIVSTTHSPLVVCYRGCGNIAGEPLVTAVIPTLRSCYCSAAYRAPPSVIWWSAQVSDNSRI